MKKPKLLIIGHGRHGKDTVAEILRDTYGLSFQSSSMWVAEKAIWPMWGKHRYVTFEDMYKDRHNHRQLWKNLIKAYNTPNLCLTSSGMLESGLDMYVGMRDRDEFEASKHQFDHIIWVEADERLPNTHTPEMELNADDASYVVNNDMSMEDLFASVHYLVEMLVEDGHMDEPNTKTYRDAVKAYGPQTKLLPVSTGDEQVDLMAIPEGATEVLDHGYVICSGKGGSDEKIIEAARQSYGQGTKKVRDGSGLIRYLLLNGHTSPLEMGNLSFQIRMPIFVMRQWVRQRTAKLNEYSGRYSEMPELFYVPEVEQLCAQHESNKQMSAEPLDENQAHMMQHAIRITSEEAFRTYRRLLEDGLSRESARIILPLNTYTVVTWQLDMNNMIKFLMQRDDPHAQWEIREFAKVVSSAVEEHFPAVYAAYQRLRSRVTLTTDQLQAVLTGDLNGLPKSEAAQVQAILREHNARVNDLVFNAMQEEMDLTPGPVKVAP